MSTFPHHHLEMELHEIQRHTPPAVDQPNHVEAVDNTVVDTVVVEEQHTVAAKQHPD